MERSRPLIDLFVRIRVSARSRRSGAAAFICAVSWAGGVDASNLGVTRGLGEKTGHASDGDKHRTFSTNLFSQCT